MTSHPVTSIWGGVELIERAIGYTRGCLQLVTPDLMSAPTPCPEWDLRTLLDHMNDSMQALEEAAAVRRVWVGVTADPAVDPVAALKDRACRLLAAWSREQDDSNVSVDGRPLTQRVLFSAGALEIVGHGWDVAAACRVRRTVPAALAETLLRVAPILVTDNDRPERFGWPVPVAPTAPPGDRLIGFLGRTP
jgi:uncharacterized protein (TIGR03086 family)